MKAALPENETERLRALEETALLDTAPDEEYDSLAALASVICETPMASVTLVDAKRQWFKAKVGLDGSETSREDAFCAHTILEPDILVVPDALKDVRFSENRLVTGGPKIRFYAGVPLETVENFRLGSLCVIDRSPRRLSRAQLRALRLLGRQVNKQIDLSRVRNLSLLAGAQNGLFDKERLANQRLFHAFMDNSPFAGYLKDSAGTIVYYNQRWADRFRVNRRDWIGRTDAELWPQPVAARLRLDDLEVLREWKTIVREEPMYAPVEDSGLWKSYSFPFEDSQGCQYVASFAVDITAEKESERQIRTYQQALEAANERLQALAVTDSLTNLPNRRAFEATLDHEFASARRYGHSLSLLMLDIDNFKAFNDGFGHEEGDRVLQCVAGIIARSFRGTDSISRYGGEEFAVILPNTPKHSAAESAERLRLAISNYRLNQHRITISVGLSCLGPTIGNKADLIRLADQALYKAKRNGKNRVCLA